MTIQVDAYTALGFGRGTVATSGHLREVLEAGGDLHLGRATWQPFGTREIQPVADLVLALDDVLIALGDDDPTIPVHASWHQIRIVVPPFVLSGELPTLPGYDPGRALARPTGTFVVLRDVELAWLDDPAPWRPLAHVAHVNRYAVERVAADIMLGFYFPGAALEDVDAVNA